MLLDEKPLEALKPEDIAALISNAVCESLRLEYKRDWWGDNDEGKREMLRDIASFANASGGHLVVGVSTKKGAGTGELDCPDILYGVPPGNYRDRILRSCRDNLDPVCAGVEAIQLDGGSDTSVVIVIRVPQSLRAPHMVTFKGLNQFWRRHGSDKQPMSTNEIREVFLNRLSSEQRLNEFVKIQESEVASLHRTLPLLHIWASPFLFADEVVDVRDQRLREFLQKGLRQDSFKLNCDLFCGSPYPTLHGLRAGQVKDDYVHLWRLYRGGYFDFVTSYSASFWENNAPVRSVTSRGIPVITGPRVAAYIENFVTFIGDLYSFLDVTVPFAVGCSFFNVSQSRLSTPHPYDRLSERTWLEPSLRLDQRVLDNSVQQSSTVGKWMNNRLWNAFGLDECPYYMSGELVIPTS